MNISRLNPLAYKGSVSMHLKIFLFQRYFAPRFLFTTLCSLETLANFSFTTFYACAIDGNKSSGNKANESWKNILTWKLGQALCDVEGKQKKSTKNSPMFASNFSFLLKNSIKKLRNKKRDKKRSKSLEQKVLSNKIWTPHLDTHIGG